MMQKLLHYPYIYLIPLLLSAILSLKSFRFRWPKSYKIFSAFLITSLCVEALAIAWKWYLYQSDYWNYSKSNLWIYNGFTIVRVTYLLWFYHEVLSAPFWKKMIRVNLLVFPIVSVVNYFLIQSPHEVNTYTIVVANLIIILLSLAFFRQLLKDKRIIKLSRHPVFWISLGNFIYYSGTLPFFILFNYLIREQPPMALSYLHINDALNILLNALYLISFLCQPQK